MSRSRLLLDPELPLCWEDATTLRLGFDRAVSRFHDPSAALQRLLEELRRGVRASDLSGAAARAGVSSVELERLMAELGPALVELPSGRGRTASGRVPGGSVAGARPPAPQLRLGVALDNPGPPLPFLAAAISAAGYRLVDPGSRTRVGLVILVERFLEPLERTRGLLDAGVPHLLVRFTDRTLAVGPVIPEDGELCLACVTLSEVSADAGLPALASQLAGTRPASETPAAVEAAAVLALSFIRHWQAGSAGVLRSQVRVDVSRGLPASLPRAVRLRPHPRCACTAEAYRIPAAIEADSAPLAPVAGELEPGLGDEP